MGKADVSLDEPENPLNPCWTDIFDSQHAFDSAVEHLTTWYDYMTRKIQNSRQKETETRVRLTGNIFSICFIPYSIFSCLDTTIIKHSRKYFKAH